MLALFSLSSSVAPRLFMSLNFHGRAYAGLGQKERFINNCEVFLGTVIRPPTFETSSFWWSYEKARQLKTFGAEKPSFSALLAMYDFKFSCVVERLRFPMYSTFFVSRLIFTDQLP